MINKSFDQIEKSDISALITNEVRENRMLDYKEKLPGSSDSEKTELLADVSSFANAAGGTFYMAFEKNVMEKTSQQEFPKM